eukprot:1136551-Pelagomonas_calceolata.AAC.2
MSSWARPSWNTTGSGILGAWAAIVIRHAESLLSCNPTQVQARLSPAASPDRQMKVYAKAMGTATRAQLALALLPVPRSNFLAWLLPEAEFSVLIKYHRFVTLAGQQESMLTGINCRHAPVQWMSWGLLYTYCLHGAGYAYVWLGGAGILVALGNTVNLWGVIALVLGLTISLTSCAKIQLALKLEKSYQSSDSGYAVDHFRLPQDPQGEGQLRLPSIAKISKIPRALRPCPRLSVF